ncbi:MAG TPA: cofactor-independent phosphoglycerate mutase [Isosphaeraceae bacterium]|jgi:2,3-bisphosphoglycerate-independent phosphoglycerate mutase|nr:cofactor-independent phosphoglycerate mutase [Isosphaeraceae bacterium]
MKYAIVIPDGAADEPQDSLGGKTPLQAAKTPEMDRIAREGVLGRSRNVPDVFTPASDVATLSLFGYDPLLYYTGRAPLEAAAMGIELGRCDWAIRCNLMTILDGKMTDFTAGHISNDEGRELMATINAQLGYNRLEFHPGVSYRNLMIYRGWVGAEEAPAEPPGHGWRSGVVEGEARHGTTAEREHLRELDRLTKPPFAADTLTIPPHDVPDQPAADHLPVGTGSELLRKLMREGVELLKDHPVNRARIAAGKRPANAIWLWGQGQAPQLRKFQDLHGLKGAILSAVDLVRGVGLLAGWDRIDVPGATGYLDTDYAAKGRVGSEALKDHDIVCVHVEAPDEASHEGRADAKIEALERIDHDIVGPLRQALETYGDWRILVSPDHSTLLRTRAHDRAPVPWAMCGTGLPGSGLPYDEISAQASSGPMLDQGFRLMELFLR